MTWSAAALPIAVAVLVVLVPGLVLAVVLRLRGAVALAVAGPLGFLVLGLAGAAFGGVSVPFGCWSLAVTTVVVGVVLVGVRLLAALRGAPLPAWGSWRPAAFLPVLGGVVVASVAVGVLAFAAVPSPDRISQTYDAVFHLNAARSIVQTGDASSLHLYRLTNPTRSTAFYPAVWHTIVALVVQLTGAPVTVATNAAWIGTAGPVFSSGCALAAAVLFGGAGFRRDEAPALQRTLVAAIAAVLASAFVAFPYLLLDFGTLYPNGLAYTTLPVGLLLVAAAVPWPQGAAWRPEVPAPRWRMLLLLLGWLVAAGFTHPRSIVSLVVLAAPLLVAWFASRMGALAATGPQGRRRARRGWVLLVLGVVVLAAIVLTAVLSYYDVGTRPISDHLNGGPARAREDFGQALLQGLLATSLVSPTQSALPPSALLAAVALAGLVALAVRPGLRWAAAAYLLVVLLYAFAAGSDSDLAKLLTGLWDKDKFRILAMLPTIGAPVVAWTVTAVALEVAAAARGRRQRTRDPRPRTVVLAAAVAALVVALVTWLGPAQRGVGDAIGTVFSLPASDKHGLLVDADEVRLLQGLGTVVPAGQTIIGNPWNGSALAFALGDREVLFPHLGGYWGSERKLLQKHLDDWRTDPAVCRAVRDLKVHWVIGDPQRLHGDAKAAASFAAIDRTTQGRGVRLVESSGSTSLYRLTACWS